MAKWKFLLVRRATAKKTADGLKVNTVDSFILNFGDRQFGEQICLTRKATFVGEDDKGNVQEINPIPLNTSYLKPETKPTAPAQEAK